MIHDFQKTNKKLQLIQQIINNSNKILALGIFKQVILANDKKVLNKTIIEKINNAVQIKLPHTYFALNTRTDFWGNKRYSFDLSCRDNDCYKCYNYNNEQTDSVNYICYTGYIYEKDINEFDGITNEKRINASGLCSATDKVIDYLTKQNEKLEHDYNNFDKIIADYEKLAEQIKLFKNSVSYELDDICRFDNIYRG